MRPEWASSTDINKTPVSKLVVYRGIINDVTLWLGKVNRPTIFFYLAVAVVGAKISFVKKPKYFQETRNLTNTP